MRLLRPRPVEILRSDANNRAGLPVHANRASQDPCIASETAHPEFVAEDGNHAARATGIGHLIVFRKDWGTQRHRNTEPAEIIARDQHAGDTVGCVAGADVERHRPESHHRLERRCVVAKVGEGGVRHAVLRAGVARGDDDEGGRILYRERAKQDGVEDAEGRRSQANAQGKRQRRHGYECGIPDQASECMSQIDGQRLG